MIKSLLYSVISWSIGQCVLAVICYYAYKLTLLNLFDLEISLIQWMAIVLIFACLMPGKSLSTSDTTPNKDPISKLDEFVSSLIKKKS